MVVKTSKPVPSESGINLPATAGEDSRLIWYKVKNFAAFSEEVINFPETKAILKINGYNDTGKSALLRGLSMLLLGRYQRDQQKFVKDGEDYFELSVGFNDGVELFMRRYAKRAGSGVFYELRKDGQVLYTTREGKALTAAKTIPDCFKRYLRLVTTKVADLNYRDRNDAPLLTGTSAKDNNEALNDVLKFSAVSDATEALRKNINTLNGQYNNVLGSYNAMESLQLQYRNATQSRVDDAKALLDDVKKVGMRRSALTEMMNLLDGVDIHAESRNKDYSALESKAGDLQERLRNVETIEGQVEAGYSTHVVALAFDDLSALDASAGEVGRKLSSLQELFTAYNQYNRAYKEQLAAEEGIRPLQGKLDKLNEEIKKRGGTLTKCPNCGQTIAVGLGE